MFHKGGQRQNINKGLLLNLPRQLDICINSFYIPKNRGCGYMSMPMTVFSTFLKSQKRMNERIPGWKTLAYGLRYFCSNHLNNTVQYLYQEKLIIFSRSSRLSSIFSNESNVDDDDDTFGLKKMNNNNTTQGLIRNMITVESSNEVGPKNFLFTLIRSFEIWSKVNGYY